MATYSVHFIGTGCRFDQIQPIHWMRFDLGWNPMQLASVKFPRNCAEFQPSEKAHMVPCLPTNSPAEYLIGGDNNENHCANCDVCRCVSFAVTPAAIMAVIIEATQTKTIVCHSWQPGWAARTSIGASKRAAALGIKWQMVTRFRCCCPTDDKKNPSSVRDNLTCTMCQYALMRYRYYLHITLRHTSTRAHRLIGHLIGPGRSAKSATTCRVVADAHGARLHDCSRPRCSDSVHTDTLRRAQTHCDVGRIH